MIAVTAARTARSPRLTRAAVVATTAAVAVSTAVLVPVFQATADAASAYAVTATIAVGNQAGGGSIAVDSLTHRGYVTSFNDSKLTVIDTGPNAAIGSIAVGSSPIGVALDTFPSQPSSPMVFVANFNGKSISFVDTTTDTVVGTVSLGNSLPTDMAVDPRPTSCTQWDKRGAAVWFPSSTTSTAR